MNTYSSSSDEDNEFSNLDLEDDNEQQEIRERRPIINEYYADGKFLIEPIICNNPFALYKCKGQPALCLKFLLFLFSTIWKLFLFTYRPEYNYNNQTRRLIAQLNTYHPRCPMKQSCASQPSVLYPGVSVSYLFEYQLVNKIIPYL